MADRAVGPGTAHGNVSWLVGCWFHNFRQLCRFLGYDANVRVVRWALPSFLPRTIPALLAFLAAGFGFLAAEYCTAVFGGGCGGRYLTANPKESFWRSYGWYFSRKVEIIAMAHDPLDFPNVPPVPKGKPPSSPFKPDSMEKWFLRTPDGQTFGPVPRSQLGQWRCENRITPQCQLRLEGQANWKPACEVFPNIRSIFRQPAASHPGSGFCRNCGGSVPRKSSRLPSMWRCPIKWQ